MVAELPNHSSQHQSHHRAQHRGHRRKHSRSCGSNQCDTNTVSRGGSRGGSWTGAPDKFGEAVKHRGALIGDSLQRSYSGLQQRIRAARLSSAETQQRALGLLLNLIQRHLSGNPAQRWYSHVTSPRAPPTAAQEGLVRHAGSRRESRLFTCGALGFGALLWLAGASPWAFPMVYLLFAMVALPWRVMEYGRTRNAFFLIDFCYWVNIATVAFLIFAPANRQLEAAVYSLADGPLAAALIVWQSAWAFGSPTHVVSVLIHALPGAALFAHRYAPVPPAVVAAISSVSPRLARWAGARSGGIEGGAQIETGLLWNLGAPLLFYALWQLMYWLVVQVACRRFILKHQYDTSYRCLARRAAKTNNILNRLVRRGSAGRRVCMYGLLQLAFTLTAFALFLGLSRSIAALVIWQALKVAVPVYCGAKHQCERVPRAAVAAAIKQYHAAAQEGYQISVDATGSMRFS